MITVGIAADNQKQNVICSAIQQIMAPTHATLRSSICCRDYQSEDFDACLTPRIPEEKINTTTRAFVENIPDEDNVNAERERAGK